VWYDTLDDNISISTIHASKRSIGGVIGMAWQRRRRIAIKPSLCAPPRTTIPVFLFDVFDVDVAFLHQLPSSFESSYRQRRIK
jgi:hypothetical protein